MAGSGGAWFDPASADSGTAGYASVTPRKDACKARQASGEDRAHGHPRYFPSRRLRVMILNMPHAVLQTLRKPAECLDSPPSRGW